MFIIMKTMSAGPNGTMYQGKKYNVSEAEAKNLVDGGYAMYAEQPKLEKATAEPLTEKRVKKNARKPKAKGSK